MLNVPNYVNAEMNKLNRVDFKFKIFILEEAKAKHKDCTPDKQNSKDHQFTNYYLDIKHQHEQQQEHQLHKLEQQQKQW